MKKIIGLALILLTLYSCENKCINSYVAIVNNSGKDVEIFSYNYNYNSQTQPPIFSKKISIINNGTYDQTYKDCGYNVTDRYVFGTLVQGDSIVIDYGNKIKWYSYKNLADGKNPFYLSRERKTNDFIYTLTPEDYANATPK